MSAALSVAVMISAGRHPQSGAPRACKGDAIAMTIGRSLAGNGLRVIHAGQAQEPSLRDYMAYGAETIELIPTSNRDDSVPALADVLNGVDMVLTGMKSEQGVGSGLFPYALAEVLGCPIVANALEVSVENGEAIIRQFLPKGQRRQIACPLPSVIAVHPLASGSLKYAYSRRIAGRVSTVSSTHHAAEPIQPSWVIRTAYRQPVRLKAQDKKAGHARMLSAIASEVKSGVVAFEGTTVDKAQVVLNYLREHRLIDF